MSVVVLSKAELHVHLERSTFVRQAWEDDGQLETKSIVFLAPRSGDGEYAGFHFVLCPPR